VIALREAAAIRVLVLAEKAADAAQVRRLLGDDFGACETSIRPETDVAEAERIRPGVVILAGATVATSQERCMALLQGSKAARARSFGTVVLCSQAETGLAFEQCRRGQFDDYVPFWPEMHDAHRLAMAVWGVGQRAAGRAARSLPRADGAAPAGALERPPSMVLVVEDDAVSATLIAEALGRQAYGIEFAANALEAIACLRCATPAAILMDVNLPGMDGLALTEWLKGDPGLAGIPVIMLTGDARRETIERSRSVGAAGFVVKPFSRESLIAKIAPFVH